MKRRDFFTVIGGAAAGITIGRAGLANLLPPRVDPAARRPSLTATPSEREAISVCGGCAAGCSVLLRVVDERIVGMRGSPRDPLGMGGVCPRGLSEVAAFYEPDRLLGPVAFSRGSQRTAHRIEWKAALAKLDEPVVKLVAAGRGARIGVALSSGRGVTSAVATSVLASLGSPHVYAVDPLRDEAVRPTSTMLFGQPVAPGYDLERTDVIFAFGADVLEGWLSPSFVARRFGRGRTGPRQLQLVYVGSHLTQTAMRADDWIRCRPGTEATVALALAGQLLDTGSGSKSALEAVAGLRGFADEEGGQREGVGAALRRDYTVAAAAQQSGVPAAEIRRLARVFAAASAPVAIGERTAGSAGMFGLAAVHVLNIVAGRVGREGGVFLPRPAPVAALPGAAAVPGRLDAPPISRVAGTSIWRVFRELALANKPPPFDVLLLEDGAALGDLGEGDPAFALLRKIPLIVSAATGLDASTAVADLVLPATTTFEQTVDVEPASSGPFSAVAAAEAAVPRLVDGRPFADVLLHLGRAAGKLTADAPKDVAAAVRHRLSGLASAEHGLAYTTPYSERWNAHAAGRANSPPGSDAGDGKNADAFVAAVLAQGGWVDPRAELSPPTAARPIAVHGLVRLRQQSVAGLFRMPSDERAWLPRSEHAAPATNPPQTLALQPIPVGTLNGRGAPNRPALLQTAAPHVQAGFRPWAALNPADARPRGIANTDILRLETAHGAIEVEARVTEGARPGTIAVPWAPWARGTGRYLTHWTAGAERLAQGVASDAIGARTVGGLPVKVARTGRKA